MEQLRHLIDLKQKQANFSEAISTRELARQTAENTELQIQQARETTRQGQTLMVFTVVTIIFVGGTTSAILWHSTGWQRAGVRIRRFVSWSPD